MMLNVVVPLVFGVLGATSAHAAGFDFGGDCSTGDGSFHQAIARNAVVTVGVIPEGKRAVGVRLTSDRDVDIQLIDQETGHAIVAWPNGDLNGSGEDCTTYRGARYCYSGYNGTQGELGHEWIHVDGDTNRPVVMKAFGYAAGDARVDYEWAAVPTCNEKGEGSFSQSIPRQSTVVVGDIPVGEVDVDIDLETQQGRDVDVQLYAGNVALVQWPDGLLNGPSAQTLEWGGMTIRYSGYNGIGGNLGHESIRIEGVVSENLTMKAFGYQAGTARVDYAWGVHAGETCGGIASLQCEEGYECKAVQTGVSDPAGQCHTMDWCEPATVVQDCQNVPHIMTLGSWSCEEFQCVWGSGPVVVDECTTNDDCDDAFCGWDASNHRVCKEWAQEGDSCEGFVLPEHRSFCDPELTCVPSEATFDAPGTCMDMSCSLFDQSCPSGFTCEIGCPTNENCGINPPGECVPE